MKKETACPWISYEHRQKFYETCIDKHIQWSKRTTERKDGNRKSNMGTAKSGSVGKHKNVPIQSWRQYEGTLSAGLSIKQVEKRDSRAGG